MLSATIPTDPVQQVEAINDILVASLPAFDGRDVVNGDQLAGLCHWLDNAPLEDLQRLDEDNTSLCRVAQAAGQCERALEVELGTISFNFDFMLRSTSIVVVGGSSGDRKIFMYHPYLEKQQSTEEPVVKRREVWHLNHPSPLSDTLQPLTVAGALHYAGFDYLNTLISHREFITQWSDDWVKSGLVDPESMWNFVSPLHELLDAGEKIVEQLLRRRSSEGRCIADRRLTGTNDICPHSTGLDMLAKLPSDLLLFAPEIQGDPLALCRVQARSTLTYYTRWIETANLELVNWAAHFDLE